MSAMYAAKCWRIRIAWRLTRIRIRRRTGTSARSVGRDFGARITLSSIRIHTPDWSHTNVCSAIRRSVSVAYRSRFRQSFSQMIYFQAAVRTWLSTCASTLDTSRTNAVSLAVSGHTRMASISNGICMVRIAFIPRNSNAKYARAFIRNRNCWPSIWNHIVRSPEADETIGMAQPRQYSILLLWINIFMVIGSSYNYIVGNIWVFFSVAAFVGNYSTYVF